MGQTTATTIDLDEQARRLRYSVTRLARLLRSQDSGGLTPTRAAALATIERHGPMPVGDLAAYEQVSAPTATTVVTKLEEAGFVRRERDDTDRRVCHVGITAAGRRRLETTRTRRAEWLAGRMAELSPDHRARLLDALDALDALTEAPAP